MAIYNTPEDTIGKNVIKFIESLELSTPNSGLSSTLNYFGEHYTIVVKQFVNSKQAKSYIENLRKENIILENAVAFTIAESEYQNLATPYLRFSAFLSSPLVYK